MKNDKKNYSRREFLTTSAKGAAIISAAGIVNPYSLYAGSKADEMPKKMLGKTGMSVSILSFGGGSQFLKNEDGVWEKQLEKALESGVNLFDTASQYTIGNYFKGGEVKNSVNSSEERFGEILPAYRSKIYISTKLEEREPGLAKKSVEDSLKRLKTDYLDILLIHGISDKDEVAYIEKGVYKEMLDLKNQGMVKSIGFSSMDSAERSRDIIEALDFDIAMLAINPTQYRNYANIALPAAQKKGMGVIAIKVIRGLVGKDASSKELFEYVWTENSVNSAMIGHVGMKFLNENIKLAVNYGKANQASIDRKELELRLASYAGPHALVWARPGYRDGGIIV
jgi:aryl-alcohol dehydrogenase-like predicted oxidoreductase